MYGCMDVWMYGCMDVWMYGCMDVWIATALNAKHYECTQHPGERAPSLCKRSCLKAAFTMPHIF